MGRWRRPILRLLGGSALAAAVLAFAAHRLVRVADRPHAPPAIDAAFEHPTPVVIDGYDGHAMEPFISRDDRYLFFNNLNARPENTNLYYAERAGPGRFVFRGEVGGVNTPALDAVASMDRDDHFFFTSTRLFDPGKARHTSLFTGRWSAGAVAGAAPVPGSIDRTGGFWINMDAEVSADGQELFISSARFIPFMSIPKESDLRLARRQGDRFELVPDERGLLGRLNTDNLEYAPSISGDGLELFFTRCFLPGLFGTPRFWLCRATRPSREAPFGDPQAIESTGAADAGAVVEAPSLSGDGRTLYYHRRVGGRFRIYSVVRAGGSR